MATTHSGSVLLDLRGIESILAGGKKGPIENRLVEQFNLDNGTDDGQVDLGYYARTSSIAASTTTVYDLVGSLTDTEGNTLSFAEIVLVAVRNRRTTALAWLKVGPDATNGFGVLDSPTAGKGFWNAAGDRNVVGPSIDGAGGAWLAFYDPTGVPVVGGAQDELAVVTSAVVGATNSWDILILGRSA